MSQGDLFAPPPPLVPQDRAEREAVLAKAPPPPERVVRIARAVNDPVGHLSVCADPSCLDCPALRAQGFQRCSRPSCGRWAHRSCQYEDGAGLICSGCAIVDCRPSDGRELRYDWRPPAAVVQRAATPPRAAGDTHGTP